MFAHLFSFCAQFSPRESRSMSVKVVVVVVVVVLVLLVTYSNFAVLEKYRCRI